MEDAVLDAFADEIEKIAKKTTVMMFKDPTSYAQRSKVRSGVRKGIEEHGKSIRKGKLIGAGGGAAVGGAGGALAGYLGGGKKALPAVLGGLAGAAAGGTGGYFGGRHVGRKKGLKKLKSHGVRAVRAADSPGLRKHLRPAMQRRGVDVIFSDKPAYSKGARKALEGKILSRVGSPDPAVLKRLGLPTLK